MSAGQAHSQPQLSNTNNPRHNPNAAALELARPAFELAGKLKTQCEPAVEEAEQVRQILVYTEFRKRIDGTLAYFDNKNDALDGLGEYVRSCSELRENWYNVQFCIGRLNIVADAHIGAYNQAQNARGQVQKDYAGDLPTQGRFFSNRAMLWRERCTAVVRELERLSLDKFLQRVSLLKYGDGPLAKFGIHLGMVDQTTVAACRVKAQEILDRIKTRVNSPAQSSPRLRSPITQTQLQEGLATISASLHGAETAFRPEFLQLYCAWHDRVVGRQQYAANKLLLKPLKTPRLSRHPLW